MAGFTIVHMDDFERPFPKWALARKSLDLQSFGMNVVELPPGETIPEHDETGSDQEEVFIVLSGDATMVNDGDPSWMCASTSSRRGSSPTSANVIARASTVRRYGEECQVSVSTLCRFSARSTRLRRTPPSVDPYADSRVVVAALRG